MTYGARPCTAAETGDPVWELADDCYSDEAREALLKSASDLDREAASMERLFGWDPEVASKGA